MIYTSVRAVLTRLPLDEGQYDQDILLEWACEAIEKLGIAKQLDTRIFMGKIVNNMLDLPVEAMNVRQVAIKNNTLPTVEDLKELCPMLPEDYSSEVCSNPTPNPVHNNILANQHSLIRIKAQDIVANYHLFINSSYYRKAFEKAYPSSRDFDYNKCPDCPQPCPECMYKFDINPYNQLVFNVTDKVACVSYETIPLNEEGDIIIPDDADYIGAIINWILARHWEVRMNMQQANAFNLHQFYLTKAEVTMAKARGKFQMKELNFYSFRKLVDRYIDYMKDPLHWNGHRGIDLALQ